MMALTSEQQEEVYAELMQLLSNTRESVELVKSDLRDAIAAADTWIENNVAAFNATLPGTARTTLTTSQKAMLLAYVTMKRYGG
jgi:hypothetical protein